LVVSAATRSIGTPSGPIGFSLTYNSQAKRRTGLVGTYTWTNQNPSPTVVRLDETIGFNWGAGSPSYVIRSDDFSVTWKGFLTVPTTGSWKVGTQSDDSSKIKINGVEVLNNPTCCSQLFSGPLTLTGGIPVPIEVQYQEQTGGASIWLRMTNSAGGVFDIPSDWLAPADEPLPLGWTMSAGASGLSWRSLEQSSAAPSDAGSTGGASVVLVDASGERHTFTASAESASTFSGPEGSTAVLTRNSDGTWTMADADSTVEFDSGGRVVAVKDGTDDLHPTGFLKYEYGTNPPRLSKVTDSVSGKFVELRYKGINSGPECSNVPNGYSGYWFAEIPFGMLCAVLWPDGLKTTLHYTQNGQLTWLLESGATPDPIRDRGWWFGWNYSYMSSVIDPYAFNYHNVASYVNDPSDYQPVYDSSNRVISLAGPRISTADRTLHTYDYGVGGDPGLVRVHAAGLNEPNGYLQQVSFDPVRARTLQTTGVDGGTTTFEWSAANDELLSTTVTPAGGGAAMKSTTIYDAFSRAVKSFGPAPASCFGANREPIACAAGAVPTSETVYDGGMGGLSATWWNNTAASTGTFNGAPVRHSFLGGATGTFTFNWSTNSPVTSVNADYFTARFTGGIEKPCGCG
jgi:large repetitive protein